MSQQNRSHLRRSGRKIRQWHKPLIEALEPRRLLSAVDWTATTSGDWDLGRNWSTGQVPGPGDDVTIEVAGVTVTIDSGSFSVNSVTASDPLVISGGNLTLAAASTISGGLTLDDGSTLTTGGTLTLSGNTAWSDATFAGAGSVVNTGAITITGGGVALNTTLDDQESITDSETGALQLGGNGNLTIGTSGIYDIENNGGWNNGTILNDGTIEKTAGSGAFGDNGSAFQNDGETINVQSDSFLFVPRHTRTAGRVRAAVGRSTFLQARRSTFPGSVL